MKDLSEIPFTPRSLHVLKWASVLAKDKGWDHVGTEHIILAVLAQGESVGAKLLSDLGVTRDEFEKIMPLN